MTASQRAFAKGGQKALDEMRQAGAEIVSNDAESIQPLHCRKTTRKMACPSPKARQPAARLSSRKSALPSSSVFSVRSVVKTLPLPPTVVRVCHAHAAGRAEAGEKRSGRSRPQGRSDKLASRLQGCLVIWRLGHFRHQFGVGYMPVPPDDEDCPGQKTELLDEHAIPNPEGGLFVI